MSRWLKYFFGLSYLNSNEVPDTFTEVISFAPCNISTYGFSRLYLKN